MKIDRVTYKTGSVWLLMSYALSFVITLLIVIYVDKNFELNFNKLLFMLITGGLWWLLSRPGKLLLTREVTLSFGESALLVSWSEHSILKDKKDIIIPFNQIKRYKIHRVQHSLNINFWLLSGEKKTIVVPNDKWELQSFFNCFDKVMREGDYPELILKPPFEKSKTALVLAWISGLILVFFISAYFISKPKSANWGIILVAFISIWSFIISVIKARRKK